MQINGEYQTSNLFGLNGVLFNNPFKNFLFEFSRPVIKRVLALNKLENIYGALPRKQGVDFYELLLNHLEISLSIKDSDLKKIPNKGPILVVANHPFGAIEGVVMAHVLKKVRNDVKILANQLLSCIPDIRSDLITVDPFGTLSSVRSNIKGMKQSIEWLQAGGILGTFPAGEVSHLQLDKRQITDPEWSESIARLIRKSGSHVLPIYFKGSNRMFFQLAGLLHPRFRTALLPTEFLNKQNQSIELRIGSTINHEKLCHLKRDEDLIDYLRKRTYLLQFRKENDKKMNENYEEKPFEKHSNQHLMRFMKGDKLNEEIENLPLKQILIDTKQYLVFWARAAQIPSLMQEIGHLRAVTFQECGAGTSDELDLDLHDWHYHQLVLWDKDEQVVIGSYRIGQVDDILRNQGISGLYTNTLFHFDKKFWRNGDSVLELGRSFIRKEYQKNFYSLNMLWKGIGQYLVQFPRYRYLMGPVSISNRYERVSRQLMVAFLNSKKYRHPRAKYLKPRHPFKFKISKKWDEKAFTEIFQDIEELNTLVLEIESDQRGVPILFKHYLKLGGKFLGFNLDPDFGNVLDGLIWVDLVKTNSHILKRFMGKEDCQYYINYHEETMESEN